MFTLRNQGAHVVGLLVLSLFVGGQVFAQDQSGPCGTPIECYEQSLANLMKERQSLQEARKEMDEKMADLQAAMTQRMQELQSRNSALEDQIEESKEEIEALKKEAGEVRVETGAVTIREDNIPELMQPNCNSRVNRGEKNGRVKFRKPFAAPPKVIMALSAIDVTYVANSRFHVVATLVDAEGFDYKFYTWCDTAIHWAEAHWIAVAQ